MKQTAMQELKDKIQHAIEELNEELNDYKAGYKQCLINIQNDIDSQMLEMEKEQLNDACYDGYYQEGMYDTRAYYDNKYKQQYKKNSQTN